jgi:hypothetical protein
MPPEEAYIDLSDEERASLKKRVVNPPSPPPLAPPTKRYTHRSDSPIEGIANTFLLALFFLIGILLTVASIMR